MAVKIDDALKNVMLDAVEAEIGASAVMKIRTGSPPTSITDADSGTVLATLNLPSDWMAAASGGSKAMSGTWEDTTPAADGTAGHWRIYESDGTTQRMQGTVSNTGGGGDMELTNVNISTSVPVSVTSFTLNMAGH